jgi:hypothetical protein
MTANLSEKGIVDSLRKYNGEILLDPFFCSSTENKNMANIMLPIANATPE